MEFNIKNIDFKADEWEVTKAIAGQVLHKCPGPFVAGPDERLPNFKVQLNMSEAGGVQNDGSGTLTVTRKHGGKFLRLNKNGEISVTVKEKKLRFIGPNNNPIPRWLALELEKAPFIDPDIAKDRQSRIDSLNQPFLVTRVQIGTFYRPKNALPREPRAFSVEWDQDLRQDSLAWLFFEYEHKLLRVRIGDPMQEQTFYNIILKFASINRMAMEHDFGNPYVCFDLLTPPVIQKEEIFRPLIDTGGKPDRYIHRVGSLNPGHRIVAPYAHHLRIVLYDDSDGYKGDVLKRFENFCRTALLRPPIHGVAIDASRQEFFTSKALNDIGMWLRKPALASNWRIAFQIEALLHNGAANTVELKELRPRVEELIRRHQDVAGDVMRYFAEAAARRPPGQSIEKCFEMILQKKLNRPRPTPPRGRFFCHHVTFTPTRLLLEGPTITQSNRVIREYEGYEDRFIRVDFRDEDRLQYRWDRDVEGASYLQERVGTLLKEGFDLAGRHFEFLGYSSSALREHAVWYVSAFEHPKKGMVTAQSIRDSLGDFSGVIYSPSKYGARMAQPFSATDPSVRISRDQWSVIPDIEENGINFTDGVGTISLELAELIWKALCEDNPTLAIDSVKPTAYQIRFLGCKGVVSVDERLEGTHMCIRPSMKKFDVPGEEYGTIEIARAIGKPNVPHLNRPLVTVLEDRGAPKGAFLKLQEDAVAKARMAHDSAALFAELLQSHHLCFNYRLGAILRRLNTLGLELKPNHLQQPLDTPFFAQLRACAINHVLRGVKHDARIPIPNSHMFVGVADEGPAYVTKGLKNVFCLPQGKIFACVQRPEDEKPKYLKGMCLISRSPVIHPGDVQRVYAIGAPPEDQLCLFAHLKNVVVFSSTGNSSLRRDMYEVIQYGELLVPEHHDPAAYLPVATFKLDRPSTIDDVCDFIVEYIHSDVVGLVSDKHIHGTLDPLCLKLAEMHSWAVDYPKNGNKVDISKMPRNIIRFKPDWHKAEEDTPRSSDYYESDRALGHLFRNITLEDIPQLAPHSQEKPQNHPISMTLLPHVRRHLQEPVGQPPTAWIDSLYMAYREELTYMASTYSLSKVAGARLREEELVLGTILAKCSQKRYRSSRLYAMRESVAFLVHDMKEQLVGRMEELSEDTLKEKLAIAWAVWRNSLEKAGLPAEERFGSQSFGLIGLGLVLECLERLGSLPPL
ncbi:RdRP-domain-containing protein [Paxillus ammoniavirescens]|nr:RdRP-domain-containing protein [Paxillus ammoniavirescens]